MANSSSNNPSTSSGRKPALSMAELMARQTNTPVVLHRGDSVKGKITKLTKNEILINIGGKAEAVVFEKDPKVVRTLLSMLHTGDEVTALVLHAESESGQPVLTLRRYIENKVWDQMADLQKKHENIEVTITDSTKGGYLVATDMGITGFLPQSYTTVQQGTLNPGKIVSVSILELNKADNKAIFSQKHAMSNEEFASLTKGFKTGEKITTTILQVTSFGIFVSLPIGDDKASPIDGLIHISEVSWDKVEDIASQFSAGEQIEAVIIGVDKDAKRVDLSIKRLTEDPFEKIKEAFPVDKKVSGRVLRNEEGNIIIELGEGIEGIIKKEKVPPTTTYSEGQTVNVTVAALDARRRRVELTPVLLEKPLTYR